jgi:integrative and conjugative element protein (TIGR02256 family)
MSSRCWIDERALRELAAEARRWLLRETGGALLGWRDGRDAVVAALLGPGPNARHRLRSFEPDGPWQVEQGRRIYEATERKVAYLGDWHTHPFGFLTPSGQDRVAARLIAEDPGFRAPEPLSAIASRSVRSGRRLVVYSWVEERFLPMELVTCRLDPELVRRAAEA